MSQASGNMPQVTCHSGGGPAGLPLRRGVGAWRPRCAVTLCGLVCGSLVHAAAWTWASRWLIKVTGWRAFHPGEALPTTTFIAHEPAPSHGLDVALAKENLPRMEVTRGRPSESGFWQMHFKPRLPPLSPGSGRGY